MRAFIAVELSKEIKEKLSVFAKSLKFEGVTVVKPEAMHVTLFFLGEIDEKRAGRVMDLMQKVSIPSFTLSCKGVGVFPNPNFIRVAWAGLESEELSKLYAELAPEIQRMGYGPEEFRAHVTVARVKDPKAKDKVRQAMEKFKDADFGACKISKLVLFKSTLTPLGPIYEEFFVKELK